MSRPTANVLIALPLILLIGLAPLLAMWLAGVIAGSLGCQLDESQVPPCLWHGIDLGAALSLMSGLGLVGIVTAPMSMIASLILAGAWIVAIVVRRLRGKRAPDMAA